MDPVTLTNIAKTLVPSFSEDEMRGIRAYHVVTEKYNDEISAIALEDLKKHPIFGPLIDSIPKEVADENNKKSRQLQSDAISNNNWVPYIEYQIVQGMTYADMGFKFKDWYELITIARGYIIPFLQKDYADGPKFLDSLNGLNTFFDYAMSVLGEAYMQQKNELIQAEQDKIKQLNDELEAKVVQRTAELNNINSELDSFTYSVSHDLRAPLRAMNGYAEMLNEDYGDKLDTEGKRIIQTIRKNATVMGHLIDELLAFSRLGKAELKKSKVDMNQLTKGVLDDVNVVMPNKAEIRIGHLPGVTGDFNMLHQAMFNLISNAVKYSAKKEKPVVEIFSEEKDGEVVISIKDNGAGFNMEYSDKLFGVFQRLHSQEEFEGTGVGLAIVQRVISKHKGKIWAQGKPNEGAVFHFSLSKN